MSHPDNPFTKSTKTTRTSREQEAFKHLFAAIKEALEPPNPLDDADFTMLMLAICVKRLGGTTITQEEIDELADSGLALKQHWNTKTKSVALSIETAETARKMEEDESAKVIVTTSIVSSSL